MRHSFDVGFAHGTAQAAASVPNFSVVVTARNDFAQDEPSWLPKEALDALGRAPAVLIDGLTADEIDQLSDADPSLAFLLADKHPASEVTRNLFRLARLVGRAAETPLPASETVMAQQWWTTGDGAETGRRDRTRLLRTLAEQIFNELRAFRYAYPTLRSGSVTHQEIIVPVCVAKTSSDADER
jgi:hypothetical protein